MYILILLLPPTNSCCILHKPCQERNEGPLFVGVHFSRTLNPETLARAHSRLRQYKGGCGRRRCRSGLATVGSSRLFVYVYVYVRVYGCRRMHIGFCLYTCITVYAFVWTRTCVYISIDMYVLFSCSFFSSPSLTCLSPPRIYVLTYLFHLLFCQFLLSLLPTALCVCYSHLPIPSFSIPSLTNFVNRVISNPFISFPISSLLSSSTPKHIVLED